MSVKKPILVDVDGVVGDWVGAVLDYINNKNGTSFVNEDVWDDLRISHAEYFTPDVDAYIRSPGFCNKIKVIPGSQEAIEGLRAAGQTIMFLTSPYDNASTWCHDRFAWIKKHFDLPRHNVIYAKDKRYVNGRTLIDDHQQNCYDWAEYQRRYGSCHVPICVAQPWNQAQIEEKMRRLPTKNNYGFKTDQGHCVVRRLEGWDAILEHLNYSCSIEDKDE